MSYTCFQVWYYQNKFWPKCSLIAYGAVKRKSWFFRQQFFRFFLFLTVSNSLNFYRETVSNWPPGYWDHLTLSTLERRIYELSTFLRYAPNLWRIWLIWIASFLRSPLASSVIKTANEFCILSKFAILIG